MKHDTLSTLAVLVGTKLKERQWMLATAESCTGGWVGQEITAIAGSSDYFDRGFITYSNAAKRELLGVPEATLVKFGAVSEETARAMAGGALKNSVAHITLSVTGIAGPGGGLPGKPVGTVCFGWAIQGTEPHSTTKHFDGDREAVRRQSVIFALQGVLERIPQ
jgi:nicotinamide-nucleotide amidase